jgi:hypothetical protein
MVMPGSSDFVNPSPDTPKELATSAGFTNKTSFYSNSRTEMKLRWDSIRERTIVADRLMVSEHYGRHCPDAI